MRPSYILFWVLAIGFLVTNAWKLLAIALAM